MVHGWFSIKVSRELPSGEYWGHIIESQSPEVSRVLGFLWYPHLLKFLSAKRFDACIVQQWRCVTMPFSYTPMSMVWLKLCISHLWGFHSNCSKSGVLVAGCGKLKIFLLAVWTARFEWLALQVANISKNWCGLKFQSTSGFYNFPLMSCAHCLTCQHAFNFDLKMSCDNKLLKDWLKGSSWILPWSLSTPLL
jgi:hypothetical protein